MCKSGIIGSWSLICLSILRQVIDNQWVGHGWKPGGEIRLAVTADYSSRWHPDGPTIAFGSRRSGFNAIWTQAADLTGAAIMRWESEKVIWPYDFDTETASPLYAEDRGVVIGGSISLACGTYLSAVCVNLCVGWAG